MIQLNPRDPRPIYEQIKESMRHLILSGVLATDEKLPSVREMATSLAINPNTIQRAYRELEAEGCIYTVSGRGSFASPIDAAKKAYTKEQMDAFDEVAKELLLLGVPETELTARIHFIRKEIAAS